MAHQWFTLDDLFRPDTIISGFKSFIWTERYAAYGDFQIVTKSTFESRSLLADGTFIGRAGSTYIGKIDTISDDTADDGTRLLTVSGSMLEAILNDRVAMPGMDDLATTPNFVLTGRPADIARDLFNRICVETILDVRDSIPAYQFGTFLTNGNLGEPTDIITVTAQPDTLYNTLKQLCDTYSLGFRFVWVPPTPGAPTATASGPGSISLGKLRVSGTGNVVSHG